MINTKNLIHPGLYLPPRLPTYQPVYLPTHRLTCLTAYIPTYLPPYLPTLLPAYRLPSLPTIMPAYLPAYLPSYLPTFLPATLPNYLPTYPHTLLFVASRRNDVIALYTIKCLFDCTLAPHHNKKTALSANTRSVTRTSVY